MSALTRRRVVVWDEHDVEVPIPVGFVLASGDPLSDSAILCRRFGAGDGPQVLALGGISAGRDVCGARGWWRAMVDHGGLDLDRYGIIGLEFAPMGDERVRVTPEDQARLVEIALDALDVRRLRAFIGASYGGMVGLAFAACAPQRLERLFVVAASHKSSALGVAWRGIQRRIVEFGLAHGDGDRGLALARQLAMTTYRSASEFETRFGGGLDSAGRSAVDDYLAARGEAYPQVMKPRRWLSLSEAIDRHSVDPGVICTPTTLLACDSDQLVPLADIVALGEQLPRLQGLHVMSSIYGHDAFLKEAASVAAVLKMVLESD